MDMIKQFGLVFAFDINKFVGRQGLDHGALVPLERKMSICDNGGLDSH